MATIKIKRSNGSWSSIKTGDKVKGSSGAWLTLKAGDKIKQSNGSWTGFSIGVSGIILSASPSQLFFPEIPVNWETVLVTISGSTLGWEIKSKSDWLGAQIVGTTKIKIFAERQFTGDMGRYGSVVISSIENESVMFAILVWQDGG